ncbi:ABC transporter ATP-binding protein [Pontibacter sp. G13]|uniref:ABC transporter ATP-binding protein n=1 Tax=Pontibacter sp. G13 TaxID=3074898 RepID=UPI0028891D37|nr:ABC transporter ATP-binding protein [Pontibacter sp. G13]WNJ17069.1 ABC transporter ATP-binding protein [Pontibacter sp. G13]
MAKSESKVGKALDMQLVRRMLKYVRPYRRRFALALFLTILLAILTPARPILVQRTLDHEVMTGNLPGLQLMMLILVGLLIFQGLVMYVNTYLTNWLGQSIIRDIRQQVYDHILSLRLQFFDRTPIGTLQTRTISDVETLNDVFTSGLVRILGDLLQLVAIVSAMLIVNWKLALAVLTTLPLLLGATWVFKNKVKSAFQVVRSAVSEMNAFLQEHLSGMNVIHIFSREEREAGKFDDINKKLRTANIRSVMYYAVYFPVVEIITALTMAILVSYGAAKVMDESLRFGELVAFIMFTQMFFRPVRMLADQFNTLQLGMVSAERIFKVLDTQEFIPDEGELTEAPVGADRNVSIEFQDVSFAYNEPEWVLHNIDLKIKAGQKVALVGSTGSGKTTMINLLNRFYEIQQGDILVNGVSIKSMKIEALRSLTGVVLQDVFLFSGSIADNITLNNPEISRETVIESAKRVGAHDFIMELPGQYDYEVRERGATLSMGQRQLISFARVMAYDPRVLVLDEATANIDTESEEIIQHAIDTVLAGRTSIIIAHRLSTIQKADNIVVLKKGKIIESGSHEALLKHEGDYFELYQMQFA